MKPEVKEALLKRLYCLRQIEGESLDEACRRASARAANEAWSDA
jgi:hypothetical protein